MKISGIKKLFSKANFKMFVKFGCVGVINTIIDTAVFFVLCDIIGVWEIVSNCAAYIVSATNSYFMNSRFVYRDRKYSLKSSFSTFSSESNTSDFFWETYLFLLFQVYHLPSFQDFSA